MYLWSIYEESVYRAPLPIAADFQAFYATVFECVRDLQPGNSVCFFTPFAVMGQPIKAAQAQQVEMVREELVKLHVRFHHKRAFLWTITVQPVLHLEREREDYRVIAHIVRVT